ncbi:MAG: hypothetical protein ACE5ID_10510, partial [Acidobacteriota bacterium]
PAAIQPEQDVGFQAARKQQEDALVSTEKVVKEVAEASDDDIQKAMTTLNMAILSARQSIQSLRGVETPERRKRIRALREGNARLRSAYAVLQAQVPDLTPEILQKDIKSGS